MVLILIIWNPFNFSHYFTSIYLYQFIFFMFQKICHFVSITFTSWTLFREFIKSFYYNIRISKRLWIDIFLKLFFNRIFNKNRLRIIIIFDITLFTEKPFIMSCFWNRHSNLIYILCLFIFHYLFWFIQGFKCII
jgi:hypothetical protein